MAQRVLDGLHVRDALHTPVNVLQFGRLMVNGDDRRRVELVGDEISI